ESQNDETAASDFAELLHSARTPAHHRRSLQAELADQIVRRLGGARESARKDFGMREHETLPPRRRGARIVEKWLERHGVEFATFGDRLSLGDVARVQTVEQQNA